MYCELANLSGDVQYQHSDDRNLAVIIQTSCEQCEHYEQKSVNLVIESNIHHHHLPSDADPAGATGVVGVHTTPEPHLETHKTQRHRYVRAAAGQSLIHLRY